MGEIKWTPSQKAAIDTRGRNILVSAAAGSGKTAVLVERIINRIMRDRNKTDIDRMLIVTFTNAAAAEMKEKINKRLRVYKRTYKLSGAKPKGLSGVRAVRLRSRAAELRRRRYEQMSALDDADICTIDSFCKKCVQSFAHELDISPDFRLYDPDEDAIVIDETASRLIEKCYNESGESGENDTAFMRLTEYYSSMSNDKGLKDMLRKIYRFLQSYAEPLEKLDEIFGEYGTEDKQVLFESCWARELMREQRMNAYRVLNGIWTAESARELCASGRYGLIRVFANVMLSLCGISDYDGDEDELTELTASALSGSRVLFEKMLSGASASLKDAITEDGELCGEVCDFADFALGLKPEERLWRLCERYEQEIEASCGANVKKYLVSIVTEYTEPVRRLAGTDENGGAAAWDDMYSTVVGLLNTSVSKPRKSKKDTEEQTELIAELSEFVKKYIGSYLAAKDKDSFIFGYINQNADDVFEQYRSVSAQARDIKELVTRLAAEVDTVKHNRNTFSFADVEHMAYRLMTAPEYKDIAAVYKERYTDIMIDEYQDTNGLQDAIFAGISDGRNMFMVGDLKQSIYAFRGGDPSIFKKKGAEYTPYDEADMKGSEPVRIDLADNFRSNTMVVGAVNELFGYVMTDELGDVDYNKKGEKLVCGRNTFDTEEQRDSYKKSELVFLPFIKERGEAVFENGEEIDHSDIEARYVARRIREMVDSHEKVLADGVVRDIEYRDFTIIASSVKSIINVYSDAFGEQGIPLAIPSIGYYSFFEVSVVLSFLRIIANRRKDVPLVTVMRSPIGGFTDEELARIASSGTGGDFFGKIQNILAAGKAAEKRGEPMPVERALIEKLRAFIRLIDRFDSYKHYKTVAAIVYSIYTETGFYDFVGAMDGGKLAQQNLTLLYEKAKKYESGGAGSLYSFVKYIERLREEHNDEEGACNTSESQNAVRMMTIHASKGLEFPVVFMVSCGKNFRRESSEDGKLNRDAGIGLLYLNPKEKIRTKTPLYKWVSLRTKREGRSEEIRKLYVGLTRARERLICVMSRSCGSDSYKALINSMRKKGIRLAAEAMEKPEITTSDMVNAEGFRDWIMPAYFAGISGGGESPWEYDSEIDADDYVSKDVYSVIEYSYGFEKLMSMPSKTTVSKIKEEHNSEEGAVNAKKSAYSARYALGLDKLPETEEVTVPEKKTGIPANVMGTAYHRVMELVNPSSCADEAAVKAQLERLRDNGFIADELAAEMKPELIQGFFAADGIGAEVVKAYEAGRLHRETPFEIAITPEEYSDGISTGEYMSEDKILLQGTIDCWFEYEDGSCCIIDYKTDAYRGGDKEAFCKNKAEEYSVQLDLYARALEKAIDDGTRLNPKVRGKYLYLFSLNRFVKVK